MDCEPLDSSSGSGSSSDGEWECRQDDKATSVEGLDAHCKSSLAASRPRQVAEKARLLQLQSQSFYTYSQVPWTLHVKKEVFSPSEKLETAATLDLIFLQIMKDFSATALCIRMTDKDRGQLTSLLEANGFISPIERSDYEGFSGGLKRQVVDVAKDWPYYFARLFPVAVQLIWWICFLNSSEVRQDIQDIQVQQGIKEYSSVQMLAVSHAGFRLIKFSANNLTTIEKYSLWDIREITLPTFSTISLIMKRSSKNIILYSHRANQIKSMLDAYLTELDQDFKFVQAVRDNHATDETQLGFKKDDVIRLSPEPPATAPAGFLAGQLNSRQGLFPAESVRPVSRAELSHLGKIEGADCSLLSESGARDSGSAASDQSHLTNYQDGHFSMMEFAMIHFKQSLEKLVIIDKCKSGQKPKDKQHKQQQQQQQMGNGGVLDKLKNLRLHSGNEREWTWSEYAEMVKFTKTPIHTSLLKLPKSELTQLAVTCFIEIMRYMGDYPLAKNQKEIDCVYALLQTLHHQRELVDEVYCQLMKQTTNNKSSRADSCQKGWRLMTILCAYYKASERLKPYLFKYLEMNAYDTQRPFNAIAQISFTSLLKTYKYGGRRNVPSQIELDSLSAGRISKRQMFLLPGGIPVLLNIRSCTVVLDCIEQICIHLGIANRLEQHEFAIYYVVEADKAARPLNRCEYVFDVVTELSKLENEFYLIFKRVLWYFPIRLELDSCIDMMYNQILPDFIEGLVVISSDTKLTSHLNNDIALLAALKHKSEDRTAKPNIKEIRNLLPINVLNLTDLKPNQWLSLILSKLEQIDHLSIILAKIKFLEVIQTWPMFGSTFFYIKNVQDSRISGECIMAINKHGAFFLDKDNHKTILSFTFSEIISTRRYRTDKSGQYVDFKCGNLMNHQVTRVETDQGNEISVLIGQYIDLINRHHETAQSLDYSFNSTSILVDPTQSVRTQLSPSN